MQLRPTLPLGIFPPFRLRRPPSFLLLGEASSSPFFPNGFSKTYSFIICSPSLFPFSRRIRGMRTLHKIGIPFEQRGVLTHPSFFLSSLFLPTRFPISPLLRHCCHSARASAVPGHCVPLASEGRREGEVLLCVSLTYRCA